MTNAYYSPCGFIIIEIHNASRSKVESPISPHTHTLRYEQRSMSVCVCTRGQRSADLKPGTLQQETLRWKRIEGYWELLLCKEMFQVVSVNSVNLPPQFVSFHVSSSTPSCLGALYQWPLSSLTHTHSHEFLLAAFSVFSVVFNTCRVTESLLGEEGGM